jgi:CubicO group peptidase (beta-lactamase class C family)
MASASRTFKAWPHVAYGVQRDARYRVATRSGEDRSARAEPRRLAWTPDRIRCLDQTDEHVAQVVRRTLGDAYGYLWWLGSVLVNGHYINWVGGIGHGGQRLYVVPSEDLVVVTTAGINRSRGPQYLVGPVTIRMALRAVDR